MRPTNKRPTRSSYFVFVDGETEKAYLNELNANSHFKVKLTIEPKLKSSEFSSPKKNLEYFIDLLEDKKKSYNKVILLLDYDVISQQDKKISKGKEKPSGKLNGLKNKFKEDKAVEILINSPCFEIWFLLHCVDTDKKYTTCDEVIKDVKSECNEINTLNKSQKEYREICKKLKDKLPTAIKNAKNLDNADTGTKAEIYRLIEKII